MSIENLQPETAHMLTTIDVVIILASMLLVIGVGVFGGRKKGDTAVG